MALLLKSNGLGCPAVREQLLAAENSVTRLTGECRFLLCDLRFADVSAWRAVLTDERSRPLSAAALSDTDAAAAEMTNAVSVLAWYTVRRWPDEASILIGVTAEVAAVISKLEVSRLYSFSMSHYDWLTPRFANRPDIWRQLLELAGKGTPSSLRNRLLELLLGQII